MEKVATIKVGALIYEKEYGTYSLVIRCDPHFKFPVQCLIIPTQQVKPTIRLTSSIYGSVYVKDNVRRVA